jgi:hypothetical protein
MLILEKLRNKYHQIWITIDGEIRDTKFDCILKGKSKLFFIRTDLAPPLHWRQMVVNHRIIAHQNLFNKRSTLPSAFYPLLWLPPSSSPSQVWPATLGGCSARRRPRGHVPVCLPWCCLPPPPRE